MIGQNPGVDHCLMEREVKSIESATEPKLGIALSAPFMATCPNFQFACNNFWCFDTYQRQ